MASMSSEDRERLQAGLRIMARLIARAYLRDRSEAGRPVAHPSCQTPDKEADHAATPE